MKLYMALHMAGSNTRKVANFLKVAMLFPSLMSRGGQRERHELLLVVSISQPIGRTDNHEDSGTHPSPAQTHIVCYRNVD